MDREVVWFLSRHERVVLTSVQYEHVSRIRKMRDSWKRGTCATGERDFSSFRWPTDTESHRRCSCADLRTFSEENKTSGVCLWSVLGPLSVSGSSSMASVVSIIHRERASDEDCYDSLTDTVAWHDINRHCLLLEKMHGCKRYLHTRGLKKIQSFAEHRGSLNIEERKCGGLDSNVFTTSSSMDFICFKFLNLRISIILNFKI